MGLLSMVSYFRISLSIMMVLNKLGNNRIKSRCKSVNLFRSLSRRVSIKAVRDSRVVLKV
jgi:hypothetical protein